MKTVVWVPDRLFADAERLARRRQMSRSQLCSLALTEFIARHAPDDLTERTNRVLEMVDPKPDPAFQAAAVELPWRSEW